MKERKIKTVSLGIFILFFHHFLFSQFKGTVNGTNQQKKEVLIGASIHLLHSKTGTFTDANGLFEIILPKHSYKVYLMHARSTLPPGMYEHMIMTAIKAAFVVSVMARCQTITHMVRSSCSCVLQHDFLCRRSINLIC